MASLQTAYNGISPYQETQVHSWTHQELVHLGYTSHSPNEDQAQLCSKLFKTVEGIKGFIWERLRLVGIDNYGSIPPFFVHLPEKNAYYHPPIGLSEYFAFNDAFVSYPEVVAHEFTHGIIEHLNPLGNKGESGAINESIADVVGIVYKRSMLAANDWNIGSMRDLSKGNGIKLKATKALYNNECKSTNDQGNTHHNSRVLSYAFYLASSNLSGYDDGNKQLLDIWISSVQYLEEKTFEGFKAKTIKLGLQKSGKPFESAIKKAWNAVDLTVPNLNPIEEKKSPTSKKTNLPPQRAPQTQTNWGNYAVVAVIALAVLGRLFLKK